jgi:hypothetical protein
MNVTFRNRPRYAEIQSFWLVMGVWAALGAALCVSGWGWHWSSGSGVMVASILAALPLVHQEVAWNGYRAWHEWLVNPFMTRAASIVSRVCYFVVFVVVGRVGTRLVMTVPPSSQSAWVLRSSLDATAYGAHDAVNPGRLAWVPRYVSWAWRSGNVWAVGLIPFLFLLKFSSASEQKAVDANIYTLF